jgi:acetolactate synthase-1/2/3 large subunit
VITGPGVTNIATPMADAYADSVPLLVIATSLPRATQQRPCGDLHELKDQLGLMQSLAGWTRAVGGVEEIPDAVRDAFRALRSGRPRGAYLQIPLDLLSIEAEIGIAEPAPVAPRGPDAAAIAEAASMLRSAQRPLIVAGAGVTAAGANELLGMLAERLQAPVLLGAKSRDVLPSDFPLAIAVSGYGLARPLVEYVAQADAALVIGSKLGDQRSGHGRLPLPRALAQIDVDPAEIGRRYPASIGIEADARLALEALLPALDPMDMRPSRAEEVAVIKTVLTTATRRSFGEPLAYLDAVREAVPRDGMIVADMTMLGYAAADALPVYAPRTFIHAGELCTIGCGMPLAMGAAVALDRPAVALCGDGGFLQTVGELAAAVQERIPVVAVVFNDHTYSAVKDGQRRHYDGRYIATDLQAPDYVALARAFGAPGVLAADPPALEGAIREVFASQGPALIEVPLPPDCW